MSATTVNKSLAVLLVNDAVKLVRCSYYGLDKDNRALDQHGSPGGATTMFKTMIPDLKVGDLAIVPTSTRVGYTVVQVHEVNVTPDFEKQGDVDWIVGRPDVGQHKVIVEKEREFLTVWAEADRKRRQEEIRKDFLAILPEEQRKALPVLDLKS